MQMRRLPESIMFRDNFSGGTGALDPQRCVIRAEPALHIKMHGRYTTRCGYWRQTDTQLG